MRILFLFLIGIISFLSGSAQEVAVSKEFNIRTDYAYEILGNVGENILLYRDRGLDKYLTGFNKDLEFKWEQKLRFEEKRIKVYGLTVRDSLFSVFYGMKKEGTEYVKAAYYDQSGRLQDSIIVAKQKKNLIGQDFQFVNSQNKKKSLLYYIDHSDKLSVYVYDHVRDTVAWNEEYYFDGANLFYDLADVVLTDVGSIVLLIDRDNRKSKSKENVAEIIILEEGQEGFTTEIPLGNLYVQSLKMSVDEKNRRIGFFGLYNEKKVNWSEGYCYAFINLARFKDVYDLNFVRFDKNLIQDIYGANTKKKKGLNYFQISNIIWRQDGGMLLAMEMQRRFSRRNNYDSVSRSTTDFYSGSRGWVDYFNEDIILTALHKDGREHWQKILFKKQFSQDDGAIYSSYFPFLTPSRLRLIFNDEIKNNNTVSEYVVNGVGKYKRESLFSTEYQNLKLRFVDALQISPTEILVPSQKNYNLALVKISYGE